MAFALCWGAPTVKGADFPERIFLGGRELALNGTAQRAVFGVRVYQAGFYVGRVSTDAGEIMERDSDAKRLRIVMLRVVPEEKFASAVGDSLARNFSDAERQHFAGEFAAFFKCFANGTNLDKGSEVTIDYLPEKGTVVSVDGRVSATIPGREFYHALLRLWIGKPSQPSIKSGLLGQK